jgi:hypothetical protein
MKNSEVGIVKGEMKNPAEGRSAGVMGRWSNLATYNPNTPSLHHSSPIKPNQA